jgi:hypothetical protein
MRRAQERPAISCRQQRSKDGFLPSSQSQTCRPQKGLLAGLPQTVIRSREAHPEDTKD